ncbi:MAG: Na-translocating system protein MpsC family protein [Cyanobacteria bacterium P01_D01_bin.116]
MCQPHTVNFANLEQTLSERIKFIFYQQLGHQLQEIQCNLLENKLIIVIKQALTKPELLLIKNGREAIAKEVRNSIEEILRPKLKNIIEEVTENEITEIFFSTHLDSNYLSLIALFVDSNN